MFPREGNCFQADLQTGGWTLSGTPSFDKRNWRIWRTARTKLLTEFTWRNPVKRLNYQSLTKELHEMKEKKVTSFNCIGILCMQHQSGKTEGLVYIGEYLHNNLCCWNGQNLCFEVLHTSRSQRESGDEIQCQSCNLPLFAKVIKIYFLQMGYFWNAAVLAFSASSWWPFCTTYHTFCDVSALRTAGEAQTPSVLEFAGFRRRLRLGRNGVWSVWFDEAARMATVCYVCCCSWLQVIALLAIVDCWILTLRAQNTGYLLAVLWVLWVLLTHRCYTATVHGDLAAVHGVRCEKLRGIRPTQMRRSLRSRGSPTADAVDANDPAPWRRPAIRVMQLLRIIRPD